MACEQKQPKLKHRKESPENIPSTGEFKTYDKTSLKNTLKEVYNYFFKGQTPLSKRLKGKNIHPKEMELIVFYEKLFFAPADLFRETLIKSVESGDYHKTWGEDNNWNQKIQRLDLQKTNSFDNYIAAEFDNSFPQYMSYIDHLISNRGQNIGKLKAIFLDLIKEIYTFYEKN